MRRRQEPASEIRTQFLFCPCCEEGWVVLPSDSSEGRASLAIAIAIIIAQPLLIWVGTFLRTPGFPGLAHLERRRGEQSARVG